MPTISMFYGILIRMFFYDTDKHHKPHIHAEYQGQVAVYAIKDGELLSGNLPPKKYKLVVAWIEIHQEDLQADWELAANGKKTISNQRAGSMNIVKVAPKDHYRLLIQAENGLTGVFDVSPYLESEAFEPLKEKENFMKITNGGYFIAWDCGADLSADTIEAKWNIV